MDSDDETVTIKVDEPRSIPAESLFFAAIAMVPFLAGGVGVWLSARYGGLVADLAMIWAAAILAFLAGVRRGLSFRTMNGPTAAQIVTMFVLFVLAAASLYVLSLSIGTAAVPPRLIAALLLLAGYGLLLVGDPIAARRGEAPLYFQRLRPVQMLVPVASLLSIAIYAFVRTRELVPPALLD